MDQYKSFHCINAMQLQAQWIVGFVDGEGCFHIGIHKNQKLALGYQVLPQFTVVQHERDINVLYALKNFFQCGVVRRNHGNLWCYRVRSIHHLHESILPFFEKHKLKTQKNINFLKFRRVIFLMKKGEHLTQQGFERIQKIQSQMNKNKSI
uniref:Homing endonuclease LAGLIDADG domain-containing protein n=1 Tax=Boodleopsis pusilla TaxID=381415 RepID=A0A386AZI9_9CHLO|nr:hypothetical protein [Boodleopsis pusilla]AYC64851.1 hypothetical protein [Boodleopsis pusilla]